MATQTDLPKIDVTGRREPQRTNVRLSDSIAYRGGAGMVAWILHRLTGLGVIGFLLWHVVDTSLLGWGPRAYNGAIDLYRTIGFRVGEVLLFGAVLYHALNGLRIITMDFWPRTNRLQKRLFYGAVALFVMFYVPVIVWMLNWMRR
jgi:succinate dehydrogenase / fumarate reductase, cytochrome b subunit